MRQRQSNYVPTRLKAWPLIFLCFLVCALPARAVGEEDRLDFLSINGNTFSNITIVSRNKTHVSFKHAHVFASVKLDALLARDQTKMGYTPPPAPKTMRDRARDVTAWRHDPRLKVLIEELRVEANRVITEQDRVIIYSVLGGVACIYFLFCLAAIKICRKTTVRPGMWVWLPAFQWVSLLKAAGMSSWYFFLLLIPPINLIVMIVWCFRICRTRQKSPALGLLLLVPIVNIFVYFYIAFSPQKTERVLRYDSGKVKLSFQLR